MERLIRLMVMMAAAAASADVTPLYTRVWTNDISAPLPVTLDVMQGEAIGLTAYLHDGETPVTLPQDTSCTLYWQTNGMGNAWWSAVGRAWPTDGKLVCTWTPAMDPGATRVQFYLAAGSGGAALYRAYGTINLRHAPGDAPNELDWPTSIVDFASIVVTNAPWVTPAQLIAATNGLTGGGGGGVTNELDPVALPLISNLEVEVSARVTPVQATNIVEMAMPQWRITDAYSNVVWQVVASNGTFQIFRESN